MIFIKEMSPKNKAIIDQNEHREKKTDQKIKESQRPLKKRNENVPDNLEIVEDTRIYDGEIMDEEEIKAEVSITKSSVKSGDMAYKLGKIAGGVLSTLLFMGNLGKFPKNFKEKNTAGYWGRGRFRVRRNRRSKGE